MLSKSGHEICVWTLTLVPSSLSLLSSWAPPASGLKHWSAHLWAMASSSLFHTFITGVRWQLLIFIWSPASSCWLPRAGRAPPPWPRASWARCACPGLSSSPLQWDRGSWSGCCSVRRGPGWEYLVWKALICYLFSKGTSSKKGGKNSPVFFEKCGFFFYIFVSSIRPILYSTLFLEDVHYAYWQDICTWCGLRTLHSILHLQAPQIPALRICKVRACIQLFRLLGLL